MQLGQHIGGNKIIPHVNNGRKITSYISSGISVEFSRSCYFYEL